MVGAAGGVAGCGSAQARPVETERNCGGVARTQRAARRPGSPWAVGRRLRLVGWTRVARPLGFGLRRNGCVTAVGQSAAYVTATTTEQSSPPGGHSSKRDGKLRSGSIGRQHGTRSTTLGRPDQRLTCEHSRWSAGHGAAPSIWTRPPHPQRTVSNTGGINAAGTLPTSHTPAT